MAPHPHNNAAQYDIDRPGHTTPVSVIVRIRRADDVSPEYPVTLVQIHGTVDQLIAVAGTLAATGWPPFCGSALATCQPRFGCYHGFAYVEGYMNNVDIKTALMLLADADHLPFDIPQPPKHG